MKLLGIKIIYDHFFILFLRAISTFFLNLIQRLLFFDLTFLSCHLTILWVEYLPSNQSRLSKQQIFRRLLVPEIKTYIVAIEIQYDFSCCETLTFENCYFVSIIKPFIHQTTSSYWVLVRTKPVFVYRKLVVWGSYNMTNFRKLELFSRSSAQ